MLTKQLRDLERHGLVRRQFFESVPPRVEYSATELGKSLHSIYKLVCDWAGDKWGDVAKARHRYDRIAERRRPATHTTGLARRIEPTEREDDNRVK